MALRNRSHLPDDLFAALSEAGQRAANRQARPVATPAPRPLSDAQIRTLQTLARHDPWGQDFSDLRSVERLVQRGLAEHKGLGTRAFTGRYALTEAGRALVASLPGAAGEPVTGAAG